jgi:hypothetical protein
MMKRAQFHQMVLELYDTVKRFAPQAGPIERLTMISAALAVMVVVYDPEGKETRIADFADVFRKIALCAQNDRNDARAQI